ncbi:MAG: hypothetical protein LBL77_00835 [Endomicrobium sp.]|jgi:hypothetical protein|nr:hypothetical protein [Endomicrobium sp.]
MKKIILTLSILILFVNVSVAVTPIKFSLWNEIVTPKDNSVRGFELGVWTYTPELVGVGLDFIYSKTDNAVALNMGVVAISKRFMGVQIAFFSSSEIFEGLVASCINLNEGEILGAQIGFLNKTKSIKGIQLGIINITEDMNGIQIGLLNFVKKGKFPVMIIVNAKF